MANPPQQRDRGIGMVRTVVNDPNTPEYHDRYSVKLIKYIPAEVLAAFIPLVALAEKIGSGNAATPNRVWIWLTIAIGAVCVLGYNRWQATDMLLKQLETVHGPDGPDPWPKSKLLREHKKLQPAWFYYVLSLVAFGAWALATAEPVRTVVGVSTTKSEYIVAAVTFVLPLADATLAHFWRWSAPYRAVLEKKRVRQVTESHKPQPGA